MAITPNSVHRTIELAARIQRLMALRQRAKLTIEGGDDAQIPDATAATLKAAWQVEINNLRDQVKLEVGSW